MMTEYCNKYEYRHVSEKAKNSIASTERTDERSGPLVRRERAGGEFGGEAGGRGRAAAGAAHERRDRVETHADVRVGGEVREAAMHGGHAARRLPTPLLRALELEDGQQQLAVVHRHGGQQDRVAEVAAHGGQEVAALRRQVRHARKVLQARNGQRLDTYLLRATVYL